MILTLLRMYDSEVYFNVFVPVFIISMFSSSPLLRHFQCHQVYLQSLDKKTEYSLDYVVPEASKITMWFNWKTQSLQLKKNQTNKATSSIHPLCNNKK